MYSQTRIQNSTVDRQNRSNSQLNGYFNRKKTSISNDESHTPFPALFYNLTDG